MNIKEIKQLMAALEDSTMDRLEIQENDFKLVLSKNQAVVATTPPPVLEIPIEKIVPVEEEDSNLVYVISPIVGTYYAAPAPGEPDFVQVGDHVKAGEVVCIIEAMKLMNEIKTETDGVVKAILVENEDGIEHGQKIIAIEARS